MKRKEYRGHAFELWCAGKVSDEVYDAMLMNEDAFCEDDDDRDERFPESYCEVEVANMIGGRYLLWEDKDVAGQTDDVSEAVLFLKGAKN